MGLEMPGFITEPLGWIGMTWPEADEDKLFEAGQTWLTYGSNLRGQAQQANQTAQKLGGEHEGDALDAFTGWWNKDDGPGRNLPDNATAAELIGAGLMVMAAITLMLKLAFIAQLIILAFQVAQAIATAFATFGATMAEVPGFIAASRVFCRSMLNRVISMVEREIANLFRQAGKLFEKVGAKKLARKADDVAARTATKSLYHDLLSQTDRVDVSSPVNGAHFYSGADDAGRKMRAYAEDATDGVTTTTLEKTPGGKYFDDMDLYGNSPLSKAQNDKIWGRLSENYGRRAEGDVTAHVHNPWEKSIWLTKEKDALIKNPKVPKITEIDPVNHTTTVTRTPR